LFYKLLREILAEVRKWGIALKYASFGDFCIVLIFSGLGLQAISVHIRPLMKRAEWALHFS